jgi:transcription initiation factor TFIID TATA-box-binding protein
MEMVFDIFRDLQIEVAEDPEIIVQNIVSGADLGRDLNLNAIAIGLGLEEIEYEPEQFPELVYCLDEPDVVTLLFGSGKLVVTGGKDTDDAEQALDVITKRLEDLGLLE